MKLSKLLPPEVSNKIQTSLKTHDFIPAPNKVISNLKSSTYNGWIKSTWKIYKCNNCNILFFNWRDQTIQRVYINMGCGESNRFNFYYKPNFWDWEDGWASLSISCGEYLMMSVLE